ncbi:Predicted glycosyl transferase [Dyadobacter soli]|uniref:Predicted glycosyl transferase n=2 Tax=Dyadobacter soli TaxID=659014 RepID=A0A1G7VMS5_9BACT|nr:Predicted glycosyl transferase [Dyadobacter soli]
MRALSIASQLKDSRVTFLGSGLSRFADVIPKHIHCIALPEDVAGPADASASLLQLSFLHYVPMNVEKVARRSAAISAALQALFPVILIVDVSVEVTLLATLCGIPTVVIRQNGDRDDMAHLHAYECAQLLIAPSPEHLMNPSKHDWVNQKTFFSGGFSKYLGSQKFPQQTDRETIGVIVGSGGTSLDGRIINALATQCADRSVLVIGNVIRMEQVSASNVVFYGQISDPASVLAQCEIVVGNAGHNTVMEMADLGKKFVCIPEGRPFYEQLRKAELLGQNEMALVVMPEDLENANWKAIISKAGNLRDDRWLGVIANSALAHIAQRMRELWESNFSKKLT